MVSNENLQKLRAEIAAIAHLIGETSYENINNLLDELEAQNTTVQAFWDIFNSKIDSCYRSDDQKN